jgi:hypothetical protein
MMRWRARLATPDGATGCAGHLESGRTKAVADGMPVIVDLGPFGQQPELVASGTVGQSGSVQLTLPVPSGEERVYWQGLVLVGNVVHLGNRMETLVRQAP